MGVLEEGDRVRWDNGAGIYIVGTLLRIRKEWLTVKADDGIEWRFEPEDLFNGRIRKET